MMRRLRHPARSLTARIDRARLALLRAAGREAQRQGGSAWLVGGVVRDLLLGREPGDLDLLVEGDAVALARRLVDSRSGLACTVHERFGTATLHGTQVGRIDLAGSRSETYQAPAALPRVAPARLDADLRRRDFSINAMALAIGPDAFGRLHDPLDGRGDLRRGLIRTLHGRSFLDDPTRVFRAVRYATRLAFRIAPPTVRDLRGAIAERAFDWLSTSRLRREIALQFAEAGWRRAARQFTRFGLWTAVEPLLRARDDEPRRLGRLERLYGDHRASGDGEVLAGWTLALAAMAESRATREALVRRLAPHRTERRVLLDAWPDSRAILTELAQARGGGAARAHAVCHARGLAATLLARLDASTPSTRRALDGYLRHGRLVHADLKGDDLLRAGVPEGAEIGMGLDAALRAKLDGRALDRKSQIREALRALGRA